MRGWIWYERRESTVRHRLVSKWPSATSQEQVRHIPSPVNTPRHWTAHHYFPLFSDIWIYLVVIILVPLFSQAGSLIQAEVSARQHVVLMPPKIHECPFAVVASCFPKTRGLTRSNVAREVHSVPFSNEFVTVASRSGGLQWEVICILLDVVVV